MLKARLALILSMLCASTLFANDTNNRAVVLELVNLTKSTIEAKHLHVAIWTAQGFSSNKKLSTNVTQLAPGNKALYAFFTKDLDDHLSQHPDTPQEARLCIVRWEKEVKDEKTSTKSHKDELPELMNYCRDITDTYRRFSINWDNTKSKRSIISRMR